METVKEMDQDGEEESEEEQEGPAGDGSYLVGLLLHMSADYSLKEQDPCDPHDSCDWDEAVHGWSRVSALSCMFPPARNARRPRNDAPTDPHCLLCADMGPPGALTSDGSPEFDPESSDANPQESDPMNAMPSELYGLTAGGSPLTEPHLYPLLLGDETADDDDPTGLPGDGLRPSPPDYLYQDHLCSKDPALKGPRLDPGMIPIHGFPVLPPVRTPQSGSQGAVRQVCPGEVCDAGGGSASAGGAAEPGGAVAAAVPVAAVPTAAAAVREGRGAKRTEETGGADALTNTEPAKDTHRPSAAPKGMYCCHSQERRHLLSTFTLPILKRYSVPLGKITDTMHRTTVSIGQQWKQGARTGNEYSRHDRSPTPQLPVLFGTKVPIVVSSQRPL